MKNPWWLLQAPLSIWPYWGVAPIYWTFTFICLDRTDEDSGKKLYVDGFSRNKKKRARVPNELFFSGGQTVDLSDAYGDKKWKKEKVRGLLNILHAYNFTVEENTPIDVEIALDPELLGNCLLYTSPSPRDS